MTEEEFAEWRKNKLLYGMHWRRLVDRNTKELLKYNETAVKYINGEVPQIYASGYNSVAEQIPNSPVAGFDFELVNADTVSNLVHEDGIILPPKKKVDPEKDKAWNAKLINAQLLQGILQGESIPEMAKRMQTVANSDLAGATRTARTMHTAAQNAGRQSGYNKAAEQGIVFEKTWLAAMQERTRDTHIMLSGQTVPYNKKFHSFSGADLEFPGDWRAPASEVYNCRCTMITKFKGFKTKAEMEKPEAKIGADTQKHLNDYFSKYFLPSQIERFIDLLKGNEVENTWFETMVNKIKWQKASDRSKWSSLTNTLYWKLCNEPNKKEFTTIFHELGHAIDHTMGVGNYSTKEANLLSKLGCINKERAKCRSSTDEFLSAMRKDKETIMSLIDNDMKAVYIDLFKDNQYTNGIQDFISGIYGYNSRAKKNLCQYSHNEAYWNRAYEDCLARGNVDDAKIAYKSLGFNVDDISEIQKMMRDYECSSELWAHLNAAYAYGGENYKIMKKYCPNAMETFEKMMGGSK